MNISNRMKAIGMLLLFLMVGLLLSTSDWDGTRVFAQEPAQEPTGEELDQYNQQEVDKYNRVAAMYARERAGAKSGWQRGQEIFYMRCWFCHSEYIIVGDDFPAPTLRDVFERQDEEYVRQMIRTGAPEMPTYSPKTLTDKDVDDLVTYLKEKCGTFETGSGCFDEDNPPPNPLYRYND